MNRTHLMKGIQLGIASVGGMEVTVHLAIEDARGMLYNTEYRTGIDLTNHRDFF